MSSGDVITLCVGLPGARAAAAGDHTCVSPGPQHCYSELDYSASAAPRPLHRKKLRLTHHNDVECNHA
jgi:hypothetical protein